MTLHEIILHLESIFCHFMLNFFSDCKQRVTAAKISDVSFLGEVFFLLSFTLDFMNCEY